MNTNPLRWCAIQAVALVMVSLAGAGLCRGEDLILVNKGKTSAVVVVRPEAGRWEKQAATDLVHYIELMTRAKPKLANTPGTIASALMGSTPVLLVGEQALQARPALRDRLKKVARKKTVLRSDAIVVQRVGKRIYLAGLTDDGHYHAVSYLLHHWGCRWYMPTGFGECVPERESLSVGELDQAYASPFEMRSYWISWIGSNKGKEEFQVRNYMTQGVPTPGVGHALAKYVKGIVPRGKSIMSLPIAEEKTIAHVANRIDDVFKNNGSLSLAMEDGVYTSDSPVDTKLKAAIYDKYFMRENMSDVFMTFYNGVCDRLLRKYPQSKARIGFLAYSNMTIPPQRVTRAARPLICALAPIDIDPIHGMDDPKSPPRQEYREMMYRWARVMQGRVWIYDYDQGMLVWRDLPNPSHQSFRQDVKHYRKAGILGVNTESRGAIATTFINLHLRGQLMWNPDLDVEAHLAEFYKKFYGPAAGPMSRYWSALFKAWENTICTEHEFFIIPAMYTPEFITTLRKEMNEAGKILKLLRKSSELTRNERLYCDRLQFTRLSFDLIDQYTGMVQAGASACDYNKAALVGAQALKTRDRLAAMNPTFTTTKLERGSAWFPGEVAYYGKLASLTDGTRGKLITTLPLEWAFHRDPNDTGLPRGWAYQKADLTFWNKHHKEYVGFKRKDYPITRWEKIRTDLYPQAQGILHPDGQSFTGYSWYKTQLDLNKSQVAGKVHIRFPGLFADAWLYVNGTLVAHRPQGDVWWLNDYNFSWDVDLTGKLKPGHNDITLRNHNVHHVSGMFRRPFLYKAVGK